MTLPRHRLCRGLFIVFEGIDGAGKTTHVRLLDNRLRQAGYDVVCLKEPTEGPWGQKLRQLAQHGRQEIPPATELEWFLQDRREDVEHNIQPALARGQIVVLDRYYFSTIAYQGALQLNPEEIRARNEAFAPPPDLVFLLHLPAAQGWQRVRQRGTLSHFERLDYLERVAPRNRTQYRMVFTNPEAPDPAAGQVAKFNTRMVEHAAADALEPQRRYRTPRMEVTVVFP